MKQKAHVKKQEGTRTIGVSPEIHKEAKIEAAKRGIPIGELTEIALRKEVGK